MTVTTTQFDTVVGLLCQGWTCGTTLANAYYIPRYSARIGEARRRGYRVERRRCEHPQHHHRSQQFEWRITSWQHP